MPYIATQNPRITDRLSWIYKIKDYMRLFGNPKTTPIVQVNDPIYFANKLVVISGTSGSITYTTPSGTNNRFYISNISCGGSGSALSGSIVITAVINGVTTTLASLLTTKSVMTTFQNNFEIPLLIDPNTSIGISFSANTDTNAFAVVTGYRETN